MQPQELDVYDRYFAYSALREDSAWINLGLPDDAVYSQFTATNSITGIGKSYEAQRSISNKDTANAQLACNQITITCIQEDLMRQVTQVYLNAFNDTAYAYTPADSSFLAYVACLDPVENGPAVYAAQSMIGQRFSCGNHGQLRQTSMPQPINIATNKEEPTVSVFPNPNHGNFTVHVTEEGVFTFAVYSTEGRKAFELPVTGNEQAQVGLTEDISPGLYLWVMYGVDGVLEQGKLVIE